MTDPTRTESPEEQAIAQVLTLTRQLMARRQEPGPVRREAHAKHHGLVRAELVVRAGLPDKVAIGLFRTPRTFPAYVRFSNSANLVGDDRQGQARGMAVKLLGVEGDKVLANERGATTHDLLLINHPTFLVRDAFDYVDFSRAMLDAKPLRFFFPTPNPLTWRVRELAILRAIRSKKIGNPLALTYWSTTPYRLGRLAVKYEAQPVWPETDSPPRAGAGADHLRAAMVETLASSEVRFDLRVQIQGNPAAMPVEDPRIAWGPGAETYTVATLRIPSQRFDSPAQMAFAERLSYTPWHCLPEHAPLGGINRVRRRVYEELAHQRRAANGAPTCEPTGDERFD